MKPKTTPKPPPARKLAEEIAAELFVSGIGMRKATRLVQVNEHGAELSGWCERAVADVIEKHLTKRKT